MKSFTSYVLDPQCAEMEWQDLWGIKSAGTRSKEMEEVVVGVLISRRTSIMKKASKEEETVRSKEIVKMSPQKKLKAKRNETISFEAA